MIEFISPSFREVTKNDLFDIAPNKNVYIYIFCVSEILKIGATKDPLKRISTIKSSSGLKFDRLYISKKV